MIYINDTVSEIRYNLCNLTNVVVKMSIDQQIYQIAAKLSAENKTPTVALIRARLPTNVPLARVIKGLQVFQSNPEIASMPAPEVESQHRGSNELTQAVIEQLITLAVTPLKAEINHLKREVELLKKRH